jgi:hypothetical protein
MPGGTKMTLRSLAALLLVASCAPTLETLTSQCQAYGFEPATTEMAQCVQNENLARQERVSNALNSLAASHRAQPPITYQHQPLLQPLPRADFYSALHPVMRY